CRLHGNDGVPDRSGPAGRPGALGTHGHDVRRRFVGALPPRPAGGLVPGARLAGVAHCGPGFPAGASGYAGGARAGRNAAAVRKRNAADRLIPHLPTWARHTPGRRHTNPRAAGFTPAKHSPGIFLHLTPKTHKIGGLAPCCAPRASTPGPSVPTPSVPPYIRFPLRIFMAEKFIYYMNRVSKTYPPSKKVLDNVSLSFYYGAKIGVIGYNGAGKSTLMKIMAGIDKDFDGEAWIESGRTVGYLSQEPQLDPNLTVKEN